jgi:DNA anti-recombination protein RmuC
MEDQIVEMKTDIALIKADVQNIQRFFTKVEASLDMMAELSKKVAVQDEIIKNTVDKLEDLDTMVQEHRVEDQERAQRMMDRLDEYRAAAYQDHQRLADHTATKREAHNRIIIDELREMKQMMEDRFDEQDEKIQDLQRWKYYAMGAIGVAMFVMVEMNWQLMFG